VTSRRDGGQAAVEFALAMPIVVVLVLGVVQVFVIGARQVALEQLARNGARAASVAADPSSAARAEIANTSGLDDVVVDVVTVDDRVTVTVRYTDPTAVPVVGRLIGAVDLSARAVMAREPP
jgi:Flp pilus assembly protein TadG